MKVLHVLAQLPCSTGSGVYFANLIKELEPYGHDQRAVFALQDDYQFQRLPIDKQYPVRFKTEELPFPVPGMSDVMPYDSTKYCDLSSKALRSWVRAFRGTLMIAADDFQPEAIILHHLWILTSLALEVFPECRSLGICHHTDLRQARLNPELAQRFVTNLDQLDTILSLSDLHQEEIRGIHPCGKATRIQTMGGGYDDAIFFPARNKGPREKVRLLYAGKIDPSKGVFALLEAFASLRTEAKDLSLSIVGAPNREHADHFQVLVEAVGSGVELYPAQPQEELARMMREHDIFVLPSFFEGLGLIAIEALASGLWTVAAKIEGLVSLLGENILNSGAIEFVDLPMMDDIGVPPRPQFDDFVGGLKSKLALQAERVRGGYVFPEDLNLSGHSWRAIAARVNRLLNDSAA